jgi:hypothetical protein
MEGNVEPKSILGAKKIKRRSPDETGPSVFMGSQRIALRPSLRELVPAKRLVLG